MYGGGISLGVADGAAPSLINCLITGNTATSRGGGLHSEAVGAGPFPATITNCTVTGNSASESAGGFVLQASIAITVTDSIFWGNTAPVAPEVYLRAYGLNPVELDISYFFP
jgi:parallel beta-helix repeat protein